MPSRPGEFEGDAAGALGRRRSPHLARQCLHLSCSRVGLVLGRRDVFEDKSCATSCEE